MKPQTSRVKLVPALVAALGAPGAIIGVLSLLSFGFSLVVLLDEYHHPTKTNRAAYHQFFEGWVRADDYLGYTLVDRVDRWRSASGESKPRAERLIRRALDDLATALARDDPRFRLIHVTRLDLGSRDQIPLASWCPDPASPPDSTSGPISVDRVEVAHRRGATEAEIDLVITYRVAEPLANSIASIEASYHRLILALLGLSGYSLLCLGYMARHAQTQRDRIAREAAAAATLELADRTCHELGNVAFVVANERRNLAGHIDLLERFVTEDGEALAAATRRAGIDPATATRLERALRREYADRGIDPELELKGSAAIARDVCRQIATCSDFIALTVRELDGHLKRTILPTTLESCPVNEIIADSLALLGPKIEAASAWVDTPDPATTAAVLIRADRRLLIHALINLIKNAIEATSSVVTIAKPVIRIEVACLNSTASLIVTDDGPGIDAVGLKRIFEPGYSTKATGRGLGLSIVRESIAAQGGVLEVSSRPGSGTSFQIRLPIAANPGREPAA